MKPELTRKEKKDVDVLSEVVSALDQLKTDDERCWVIESSISRFKLSMNKISFEKQGSGTKVAHDVFGQSPDKISQDLAAYLASKGHVTQGQRAALIAHWAMTQSGAKAITGSDLKSQYDKAGEPAPNSIAMTIKAASYGGKKMFNKIGRDEYELTFNGKTFVAKGKEAILQKIRKSKKTKPKTV